MSLAKHHADSFVRHSVALISLGFDDAKRTIDATTVEEVITDRITRAANARLLSGEVPAPLLRLAIYDDGKVSNKDREGKYRRRIDIRVEGVMRKNRPTLEVEAKCLRQRSHPISRYTGSDGLELFVSGEYACDRTFGAMLGYMQSNDSHYWEAQLLNSLQNMGSIVGECEQLSCFAISDGLISNHSRADLPPIAVHHFLLDCI